MVEVQKAALEKAVEPFHHHGGGGAGGGGTCAAKDDTTCDGVDDDCDGKIDEDCDFGPSSCPAGSNIITGTRGDDVLVGTPKADCILGYGGHDVIFGLAGNDVLVGGPGDDLIYGWQGDDTILGGAGDDQLFGGEGRDNIDGGDGNDLIDSGEGKDIVHGGACHDVINGDGSPDDLFGDSGSDRVLGRRGRDHIDGGDGVDACDGTACELPSSTPYCRRDSDCRGGKRCVTAVGLCVSPSDVAFTDATCDGIDDDCDGKIDEDFVSTQTHCGPGACGSTGMTSCVNGHLQDSCTATGGGSGSATDATCDGVDDDCDGKVDEDFVGAATTCGVGACSSTGTQTCVGGVVKDSCTPGTGAASDATCDGIDDNCNGAVDEDYASAVTHCGVGACVASGSTSCVGGAVIDTCLAGTPIGNDSTCDGVDDNCNGLVDENYVSIASTCGVGACASTGSTSCVAGAVVSSCVPGAPAANDATCDGIDDNCNGVADEDYASVATSCGLGACASTGSTSCVAGAVVSSCVPGAPAANDATCDGIDDNCNGVADEGYASVATSCGVGACVRSGSTSCSNGAVVDSCKPGAPAPSDTTCDGVDDNCNGTADEGYVSLSTSCGVGACVSTGSTSCSNGSVVDSCKPGTPAPSDSNCDGIDNNCNGVADEGFVGQVTSCGIGACKRSGSTSCVNGSVVDGCTPGTPAPSDTTCDLVDDNCNGVADEGYVPTCSNGSSTYCSLGSVHTQVCNDGNVCNGTETCTAGLCQNGTPPTLDDGDPCTSDSCDPIAGVKHTAVAAGTSCADSNVCNGSETCQPPHSLTCTSAPSGMIAWWPGDGNTKDIVSGLDGTATGALAYAAAEVDQGFTFDGSSAVMDVSSHASALNLAGQATLAMWVRVPDDTCRTIFHMRQDSTHEQFLQVGNCNPSARTPPLVSYSYVNGGTVQSASFNTTTRSTLVDASRLHHLALTFDGKNLAIYIDGSTRAVTINSGTSPGVWGAFGSPTIATFGTKQSTAYFNGLMDEVALFDHALTATQISSIYSAFGGGMCKPPVCTAGSPPPAGTACGSGGQCDGVSMCVGP